MPAQDDGHRAGGDGDLGGLVAKLAAHQFEGVPGRSLNGRDDLAAAVAGQYQQDGGRDQPVLHAAAFSGWCRTPGRARRTGLGGGAREPTDVAFLAVHGGGDDS